jgi:hypothetical protein
MVDLRSQVIQDGAAGARLYPLGYTPWLDRPYDPDVYEVRESRVLQNL